MTRTVAETDRLLDLLNAARRELDELRRTIGHGERVQLRDQLAAARRDLAISEAANEPLRTALAAAERGRQDAVALQRAAQTEAAEWHGEAQRATARRDQALKEAARLRKALAADLEAEPEPCRAWWLRWLP